MFNGRKLPALLAAASTPSPSSSPSTPTLSRRQFVFGASLIGSALMVGCTMQSADDAAPPVTTTGGKPAAGSPFEAYLAIAADGLVTVYASQFDMGQNVYHGLATLVAEELDVALDKVRVEGRAGNPKWYGNLAMGGAFQLTGGSSSMPSSWERYRKAGATARELLKQAAAKQWKVAIGELSTANGEVVHAGSDRRAPYGSLIAAAAPLAVSGDVALKDPKMWTLIGKDAPSRIDARAKSDGSEQYTIDIVLPGMLIATVAHSPRFGGKVKSFDATAAKAVPAWSTWCRSAAASLWSPTTPGRRSKAAMRCRSRGTTAVRRRGPPKRCSPNSRPCRAKTASRR